MARRSGKSGGGAALLRSLVKLGRTQQKAAGKVVAGLLSLPAVTKPPARKVARKRAAPPARAPAVAPGKWLAGQEVVVVPGLPARRMRYWLYLPQAVSPEALAAGLPLVLMLHGCQQSATEFAEGTRMNLLAEKHGYAVLYPQQSASVQAQRCWRWFDRATQQGGGDVQPVAAVLARVLERYRIDRRRIYACGISAGAGMAHILALNFPDLFAAVGLHSGPVFGAGNGAVGGLGVMRHGGGTRAEAAVADVLARRPDFPGMPTIVIHGAGDAVVHPVNQQQLIRQALLLNGLPADTLARIKVEPAGRRGNRHGHEVRDYYRGRQLVVRAAHVDVLEHAWSGGDERLAFNAKAGPDASRMMLAFFAKQRR